MGRGTGNASLIYLDHHATTPIRPEAVAAWVEVSQTLGGNPHSDSHAAGRDAAHRMDADRRSIAHHFGVDPRHLIVTSGATESNNLAITGVMTHPRQRRHCVVTVATEHPAVLDVCRGMAGPCECVVLGVEDADAGDDLGKVDFDALREALDDSVALVSVMLVNNESGVIQSMGPIAEMVHAAGAPLHCDATQAVGRMPVDPAALGIDLMSFSAHKFGGPKGIGGLLVGTAGNRVRLRPQILGGGQQQGLRCGTMAPAMIAAMAAALTASGQDDRERIGALRDRFWERLAAGLPGELTLNGPSLKSENRIFANLNLQTARVEGEAWMAATPGVALSSGSACSSRDATPSHVLLAMGLTESQARRSVRFGFGDSNTEAEIDSAADQLIDSYQRLSG